jgi:hypothetical protein
MKGKTVRPGARRFKRQRALNNYRYRAWLRFVIWFI